MLKNRRKARSSRTQLIIRRRRECLAQRVTLRLRRLRQVQRVHKT